MTTPGERRAKIAAGEKPAAPAGAIVRTAAGVFAAGAGSRTTTVFVVSPPTSPAARPRPSAAAAPRAAQTSARTATRTKGL